MLKDRGNIKWTAMMLPEHVAMLRELKERENDQTKPLIDEQQSEEFNEMIRLSLETKAEIKITYYKDFNYKSVSGVIRHFDISLNSLQLVTEEGTKERIYLENIIEVKKTD